MYFISSADEKFDGTYPVNVVITNNGEISYIPPGIFKSTCKINIRWFPFDDQRCTMKFGSWTYDGSKINLLLTNDEGDTSTFVKNGEWDLIGWWNVLPFRFLPSFLLFMNSAIQWPIAKKGFFLLLVSDLTGFLQKIGS